MAVVYALAADSGAVPRGRGAQVVGRARRRAARRRRAAAQRGRPHCGARGLRARNHCNLWCSALFCSSEHLFCLCSCAAACRRSSLASRPSSASSAPSVRFTSSAPRRPLCPRRRTSRTPTRDRWRSQDTCVYCSSSSCKRHANQQTACWQTAEHNNSLILEAP